MNVPFSYLSASGYQVRARLKRDDATWGYTGWKTITDAPHTLEIEWHAAASGSLIPWIDGLEKCQ